MSAEWTHTLNALPSFPQLQVEFLSLVLDLDFLDKEGTGLWCSPSILGNLRIIPVLHSLPSTLAIPISKTQITSILISTKTCESLEGKWMGWLWPFLKDKLSGIWMIAELGGRAVPGWHCQGLLCWIRLFLLVCWRKWVCVSAVGQVQNGCCRGLERWPWVLYEGAWWRGFRVPRASCNCMWGFVHLYVHKESGVHRLNQLLTRESEGLVCCPSHAGSMALSPNMWVRLTGPTWLSKERLQLERQAPFSPPHPLTSLQDPV